MLLTLIVYRKTPQRDCYFWQEEKCQFPNNTDKCKRMCLFFLKGTDRIKDQIDIVTFVVNRVIAKTAIYVCVLSLIIAAISMIISFISLLK